MSSSITAMKLSSGEEIIGVIDEEMLTEGDQSQATFILSRVFVIAPVQNREGGISFTFMPFMMSNPSGKVAIYAHSLVGATEPSKAIQDKYLELTSGIKIAKDVPQSIITK